MPDDAKAVVLKDKSAKLLTQFNGSAIFSSDMTSVTLTGKLTLDNSDFSSVSATLKCKEMTANR